MTLAFGPLADEPIARVTCLDASKKGPIARSIPILRGRVDGLPRDLDALVLASDLQAVDVADTIRLVGEKVAETLVDLVPAARTGVVLAGDLWADPACRKLGGLGDVRPVWRAFAERFRWVAGVAGNHDAFGPGMSGEGVHLLDGDVVELDGLRLGGVGGIVGNPRKPNRREAVDQTDLILTVLARKPDLLVLHEGPEVSDAQPGEPAITEVLEVASDRATVVCGHCHWRQPLARLGRREVLNVDARVVVLTRT